MAYRGTVMTGLRLADPEEWARRIRGAMAFVGGRVPDAAAYLDVHPRTLFRWLQEPALADVPRAPVREPRPGNRRGRNSAESSLLRNRVDK